MCQIWICIINRINTITRWNFILRFDNALDCKRIKVWLYNFTLVSKFYIYNWYSHDFFHSCTKITIKMLFRHFLTIFSEIIKLQCYLYAFVSLGLFRCIRSVEVAFLNSFRGFPSLFWKQRCRNFPEPRFQQFHRGRQTCFDFSYRFEENYWKISLCQDFLTHGIYF